MTALLLACTTLVSMTGHAAVSVRDDAQHDITLQQPARRIISLSPHATELLYAIGAGNRLVARDSASDYPAAARALPAVGQYGAFNVEAIVALRPDLVIAWEGPQAGPATQRLRELGIAVFASEPATIDAIAPTLRALGKLTALDAEAGRAADAFDARWHATVERYRHARPLVVVPQVSDDPAMTVNDHQFLATVFKGCGTRNPFGDNLAAVPLISQEALIAARPDAIVALGDDTASTQHWTARWTALPAKPALLTAPASTLGRPGPRVLDAAAQLCTQLDRLRQGAR
ncbi:MAG: ABC transporter substrate-binding protein [Burkholderiales bacterium]|nr:ABC transporter substrate-binding protein [Burkholderiales bacterium]